MRRTIIGSMGSGVLALGLLTACGGGGGGNFSSNAGLVKLTTEAANPGVTGQAYSTTFAATFPHPPGLFQVSGGALPPGVILDSQTGVVSGYPRTIGNYRFQIAARDGVDPAIPIGRDANFAEDRRDYSVVVTRGPPQILPQIIPTAQYRASFGYQIDAAGGTAPFTFTKTGGTLPAGLTLSPSGFLGSFPTQALQHPYSFDVLLTDAQGLTDAKTLTVDVVVLPLVILTSAIPAGAQNFPYDTTLTLASTGAGAPITWSQATPVAGETLLSSIGMQITPQGHVTNLPPATGPTTLSPAGGFLFTAQVTDESLQTVSRQYSLQVKPGPTLTNINPKSSAVAGPYTATGLNFQTGATLVFKPGPSAVTITPTVVNSTTLTFPSAPATPSGGGAVTVRVLNPDGGYFDLLNGFVFPLANMSFGTKAFVSSTLSSTGVAVADLNGDGRADIVHCGASGFRPNNYYASTSTVGGLELLINTGSLAFTTTSLDTGNYYDVEIADVNTDGKPDIVALGQSSIRVWINNPLGTFTAGPITPHSSGSYPQDLSIASLNGDSIPDVVFGSSAYSAAGACYAFSGNGSGGFALVDSATSTLSASSGVVANTVVDFDGDGRQDVVAGTGFASSGAMFRRSSTQASGAFGTWISGPNAPSSYAGCTALAAGNYYGDGRPAIVLNYSQDPSDGGGRALYVFSGSGLATQTTLTAPATLGKWIGTGDFDLDGKTDWALSMTTATVGVYKGATLSLVQTLDASAGSPSVSAPRTGRIASGDLDADGRPDLVVATSYWARDWQPEIYSGSYQLNTSGDGGTKGLVIWLNSSN
jgi:hypothetical protein